MAAGCFSFFSRRPRASPPSLSPELDQEVSSSIQSTTCRIYNYKELCLATDDFSPRMSSEKGGTLRDGTPVALKNTSSWSSCTVVALDGGHRILVYEYLHNNSLAQTLLGEGGNSGGLQFSWLTRRGICIGVAKGLAFLHEDIQPHIVHRDIKASNILLDQDLRPRISDFGLAKLFPPDITHVSTQVAGTAGYLAPEYAIRGHLNRKADVYSFGVLVMEIVQRPAQRELEATSREQILLEKAWRLHEKDELVHLVDSSLCESLDVDEAYRYLRIGLLCTQDKPKLRPTMSKVVKMLEGEIDVNQENITRPGILTEFKGIRIKLDLGQTDTPDSSDVLSSGTRLNESSSSADIDTSYATMTFNSIYDRS
ncbi:hypothetical protein MLD38_000609 [Melastoma candidum]|uniref:Uncharacterized protein n=1 Tax=Melastoma candidum TaxID=119954 RepID=A0ACB9SDY7_9MYRT|nr:hypothetical protein MLD38_000609 [Melastoma candidum]